MSLKKAILTKWQKAKEARAAAEEKELILRNEICEIVLAGKEKGTSHYKEIAGFDVAAVANQNVKIDKDILKCIFHSLTKEERACIRYKPELKLSEFSKLPEDNTLQKAVIVSQGTPSLSIKILEEE